MELEFFAIHDAAPLVFHCERMRANITLATCTKSYENRYVACKGCPIGEEHIYSNAPIAPAQPSHYPPVYVNFALRRNPARPDYFECVRCRRKTERIVSCGLCVSCFNRQAEVFNRANAKGTFPLKAASNLYTITALVMGNLMQNNQASKYAPTVSRCSGGSRVKGVFSGIDELRRWLNLYHQGGEVVSFESCALTGNKC